MAQKREEERNILTWCLRDAQLWSRLIFLQNCDTINSIILLGVAEQTFNPHTQECQASLSDRGESCHKK